MARDSKTIKVIDERGDKTIDIIDDGYISDAITVDNTTITVDSTTITADQTIN